MDVASPAKFSPGIALFLYRSFRSADVQIAQGHKVVSKSVMRPNAYAQGPTRLAPSPPAPNGIRVPSEGG